jgi:Caspase domain/Sel1 repeat
VQDILNKLDDSRVRLSIVILDACRDNPFLKSLRSSTKGLAQINPPTGTVMVFATAPGKVAADGNGDNSIFTSELVKAMNEPGRKLMDVFERVTDAVERETEPVPQQVPLPAASMSAEEPTSKGDEAVKRKDYTEAMRRYRKAADQGNVYAQTSIGVLYEKGSGVTQDYAEAMRWYRKAADQGYAQALTNIGTLYRQGSGVTQDYAEAMRWYRKGADRGNSSSLLNIGFLYEKGWGVTQDHVEAMRWYMKASDLGNAQAQYNIGQHYYNGSGVAKNYAEAMRWFRQAADRGRADAQNILSSAAAFLVASSLVHLHASSSGRRSARAVGRLDPPVR